MDPLEIAKVIGVEGDTVEARITRDDLHLEYHGKVYRVGKLGSYVTIPLDRRTLIGYVTRVGRVGAVAAFEPPDAGQYRTLAFQLLGTIQGDRFSRGVNEYPTLGDRVRLGVDEDFELIFGCFDELAGAGGQRRSFSMGRFAIDTDFEVKVLGKEFFAKHVAVMGNSGSGKSVSTAKIVHEATRLPHSQVVMFDMHGEYLRAFSDEHGEPLPNVTYLSDRNLILPYWMLAFEEFEQLFVDTSNPLNLSAQRVFLRQAFERLKRPAATELGLHGEFTIDTPVYYSLEQLQTYALNMNEARFVTNTDTYAFSRLPYRQLPREEQERLLLAKRMEFNPAASEGETAHATFNGRLLGLINMVETRLNDRRYDFLLRPFEQARRNVDLASQFDPNALPGRKSATVSAVIRQMLGLLQPRRNLTIVDLSGLPFEVVDVTVAVLTRALFDFNFWSPPERRQPVLLVYEEAHNYLPRKPLEGRKTFARNAVEKVAKEGRKYGVSAMIVSQRPSEISETILSQCNSMVLLRMNNPDDQEYAARVVSDQFRSLISLLPSLRPGEGFIIGDAVLMPMRTLIDRPPKEPQSANVDFYGLWAAGESQRDVDEVIHHWWRQERTAYVPPAPENRNQPSVDQPPSEPLPAGVFDPEEPARAQSVEFDPAADESRSTGFDAADSAASESPLDESPDAGAESDRAAATEPAKVSPAQQQLARLAALIGRKRSG
ncbi:MAG: DUF87 domain-containing protein [Phycisphaerae bacterium]|jgi:hypothetical protein